MPIRARGDAAVIYDSKGTFTSHYYDAERGDVLLNPLDARTRPWSPWAEIEDEMDADRVAHALIPAGDHSTPFFHDTARAMLSAALMQMRGMRGNEPALERLLQLLLHASSDEREAFYRGTDVTQIYDKGGERMRVSVEQNLRTYVRTLRYLPLTSGGADDFSILRHIQGIDGRDRQPWLFLPSPLRAKHTAIKPLLTCWLDCAVAALLSCGEQRDRRCWFIVDEVKSLHRVPSLSDLMAEGRSFGACVVLGFQDLAQLRDVYGADDAKTMSAVLGTKVLFRIADPETAKMGGGCPGRGRGGDGQGEHPLRRRRRHAQGRAAQLAARAAASGDAGRVAAPGALSLLRPALRCLAGGADHAAASEHRAAPADRQADRAGQARGDLRRARRRRARYAAGGRREGRSAQPTKQRRRRANPPPVPPRAAATRPPGRHPTLPPLLPSPRRRPRPRRSRAGSEPC